MALRGTLSDFGIADIFQLVGHQAKTGVLLLKNREREVRIYFKSGNVVRADESSRDESNRLGNLMVRAEVLRKDQLEAALEDQARTMRRLGDALLESGAVTLDQLKEFTKLQTTETIYRLFLWKAGTYEFSQQDDIDHDEKTQAPIRAEEILMEAFRMVDEWPSVREVIVSSLMVLKPLKGLPAAPAAKEDDEDDFLSGLDDAFSGMESGEHEKPDAHLGGNERKVFHYVETGRTVQRVIDLSRMGEFEASKALANLVRGGYVEATMPALPTQAREGLMSSVAAWAPQFATRIALYAVVAAAIFGIIKLYELDDSGLFAPARASTVLPRATETARAAWAQQRLERALHVYRLTYGRYPAALSDLAVAGWVNEADLHGPFEAPFRYRTAVDGFELRPPLR